MNSLELFAGAGGLAMGAAMAGFRHKMLVEWDGDSCDTLRYNKQRGVCPIKEWPLFQGDVRDFDYTPYADKTNLVSGGPPCQPFSLGGKHRGNGDSRDMFPEAIRAVREVRPKAFLFENVKGLLRESFAKYFAYISHQLNYPEVTRRNGETWVNHLSRLEKYHTSGKHDGLHYRVLWRLLNAADYGVPQRRERVVLVGIRGDLRMEWSFPETTHSEDALWWSKWGNGEYWERNEVPKKLRTPAPSNVAERLRSPFAQNKAAWLTVRDALADLPDPRERGTNGWLNHVLQSGARVYPGHTGSPLDEPSKTLKAGDHGVPGGENMMVLGNGNVRYFTVREGARLQTFPDAYAFPVSWTESMRQIGNAVPVALAHAVARHLFNHISKVEYA